jgi:hypothetical protein
MDGTEHAVAVRDQFSPELLGLLEEFRTVGHAPP